jgi:hypothetical protein
MTPMASSSSPTLVYIQASTHRGSSTCTAVVAQFSAMASRKIEIALSTRPARHWSRARTVRAHALTAQGWPSDKPRISSARRAAALSSVRQ